MRLKDQHLKYKPEERIPLKNRDHFILTAFLILRYLNISPVKLLEDPKQIATQMFL